MTLFQKKILGFVSVSICLVTAGCATAYKDVMQDKIQYLKGNFTATHMTSAVSSTLNAADKNSMAFSKVVYRLIPHVVSSSNDTDKIEKENTVTLLNAGGPLLMELEEDMANNVAGRSTFATSYRGILRLRSQFAQPGAVNASLFSEVKEFTDFSNLSALKPGSEITFAYTYGNSQQLANFRKYKYSCKTGQEFAASSLNQSLAGSAIALKCQTLDEVGVAIDSSESTYLSQYGFVIPSKHATSTYTTTFELKDIQITP